MPRNSEVIRQWKILQRLDGARYGASVDDLASEMGVTKRTIWRDVAALQDAGFPLADEKTDGRTRWSLANTPFKDLGETGLTLIELCSFYMSRALVDGMAGTPFAAALDEVFRKLTRVLPPRMREFLDRLPSVLHAKPEATKKRRSRQHDEIVARAIEASLERRVSSMHYFSASSNRAKDYEVHPCSVTYADGGLYLIAWVPEYHEVRTFALERIRRFVPQDRHFEPIAELPKEAFAHSLGVNRGKPERVDLEFARRVARYVRERQWHASQQLRDLPDGGVRMTLTVCHDWALRRWILGFGAHVRVVSPSRLAEEILEQLEDARDAYAPKLDLEIPPTLLNLAQPRLPRM